MQIIGLTGGMGMGKSTVAGMFRAAGVPVFDADACVHKLQAPGGAAVEEICKAFPNVRAPDGGVDRHALRSAVIGREDRIKVLEMIVHPLVRSEREKFRRQCLRKGFRRVVFDIPLLMETGGERYCDVVVVVTAPGNVQRSRVARRRSMTDRQARAIIARQMPDALKRRRADTIIRNGLSIGNTRRQVGKLISLLKRNHTL